MSQTDAYRRIMAAMPDDAEVQELCRRHVEASESRAGQTRANFEAVRRAMSRHLDEGTACTARELAEEMADREWTCRKAGWYLSRLEGVTKVVAKGQANRYHL